MGIVCLLDDKSDHYLTILPSIQTAHIEYLNSFPLFNQTGRLSDWALQFNL